MKLYILTLLVSCVSCGYVINFSNDERAQENNFVRQPVSDSDTIKEVPGRGKFSLNIIPFHIPGEGIIYWAELIWQPQGGSPTFLELLKINWPGANFKVSEIKSSILPQGIDNKNKITVKYLRERDCILQNYIYDSRLKTYKGEESFKNC